MDVFHVVPAVLAAGFLVAGCSVLSPIRANQPRNRHDKRYRCSRSALVFTRADDDGEWCVTCGRLLTPKK